MPGGWQRDGWWPAGIGRQKLLREGTAGTAVIKRFEFLSADEASQADITLEVRVDGREPYEIQGCFSYDGAAAAGKRAGTNLAQITAPGSVVAVRVHPKKPKKVAIDWDASPPA